jgi:hypothetical protein
LSERRKKILKGSGLKAKGTVRVGDGCKGKQQERVGTVRGRRMGTWSI